MSGRAVAGLAAVALAACGHEPTAVGTAPPEITSVAVTLNANNVISAIVSVQALHADSVRVRFRLEGSGTTDELTPFVATADDAALVPVFGLLPERGYTLHAEVRGAGGTAASAPLTLTTGALPIALPRFTASGSDPTPGYLVFAVANFAIAIDNSGRIVWYHRLGDARVLNVQPLPNGRVLIGASETEPGGSFGEIDVLGTPTRRLGCANGLTTRFHDLIAVADGSYWLMCDEVRTMNLSAIGGVANARVTGTVVQHVSATGALLFEWSVFDHFALTDMEPEGRLGTTVNWTHGNAIAIDTDGHLLISFRSLNEIAKVDTRTGTVLWRMGGRRNQFAFEGATSPAFARQHGLRPAGPGTFTILDNAGGGERASSGERYIYDEATRTARVSTSFVPGGTVAALLGGSTQQLPRGHVLIAYGSGGRVEEYDAAGRTVWRIDGDAGYVFRATRIASLYHPVPY